MSTPSSQPPSGEPWLAPALPWTVVHGNDRAAASVVVGVIGVLLSWTIVGGIGLGVVALTLANAGRRKTLTDPAVLGRRQATVGAALGALSILLGVAVAALFL